MPELPEVETVVKGLNKLVLNKKVVSVESDWKKSFPNDINAVENFLINSIIKAVRRRAKVIIIDLNTNYSLICHLRMTGQLVYRGECNWGGGHPNDDFLANLPNKSTRVTFSFSDNTKLFFNDQRKFGYIILLPTSEINNLPFFKKVGPEPLEDSFKVEHFIERVSLKRNSMIKPTILDQSVIAGVGNIYADESLWEAKIHPTDRNYVKADGTRGNYLEYASVYHKNNEICKRCKKFRISKIKVAGRGTHICENCQKVK